MKLVIMICLEMFVLFCAPIHKYNSNDKMEQKSQERLVHNFAEIPTELLNHLDKMGVDSFSILNEYEGKYLNFIFKVDSTSFNLIEKKIGFLGSKKDFFNDERMRFYRDEKTGVGGCCLYIFNAAQKVESGGYDAAIMYWSKFLLPVEQVVKRLKSKR